MNLLLQLDCAEAPDALWLAVALPSEADPAQMLCLVPAAAALGFSPLTFSVPPPELFESPELVVLLGHREELRDVRCLRFWEIDRWRFLMEEPAARVTTQG